MTIWIDPPQWPAHGRGWSHLISDTSYEELHAFAAAAGMPLRGFEGDHYDVPQERYAALLAAGARQTSSADIVARLQDSRLRLRKRRGEKGIARALDVAFPDGSRADVDFVRTTREAPETGVFASTVYLQDAAGHWLVCWSERRGEWSVPGGWREVGETPRQTVVRELREETGLVLEPAAVRPVAYERFHPRPGSRWPTAGRFLSIYRAGLDTTTPPVSGTPAEPARWVGDREFGELAADRFWEPIATHIRAGG